MYRRYYTQAEDLVETVSDLQKQVLVKHTALILEEIHDQIKARDAEIERLRKLLDRIAVRNPDGSVAIRVTEDALNAAAEYLTPNAAAQTAGESGLMLRD